MKYIFTLFCCYLCLTISAQVDVEITPSSATKKGNASDVEIKITGMVTNLANKAVTYKWTKSSISQPGGWLTAVCDKNRCYEPDVNSAEFLLGPNQSGLLETYAYPENIEGTAQVKVVVEEVGNPSNTTEAVFTFTTLTVNTKEPLDDVLIAPNPTTDLIRISGITQNIEVKVYNYMGQLWQQYRAASTNLEVDMSSLPTGLYIVELFDPKTQKRAQRLLEKI